MNFTGQFLLFLSFSLPPLILSLLILFLTRIGGFPFDSTSLYYFNFHPLLQYIAFLLLPTYAILIYRLITHSIYYSNRCNHNQQKYIHLFFHLVTIVSTSFGIYSVVDFHSQQHFPHFQSAHSWIGLLTLALFLLNFVAGFLFYIFKAGSNQLRSSSVILHQWIGLSIYILAGIACVSGIVEKSVFETKSGKFITGESWELKLINGVVILIAIQVMSVVGIVVLDEPVNENIRKLKEMKKLEEEGRGGGIEGIDSRESSHLIPSKSNK